MNLRIISTTIATLSLFSLFCLIFLLQGCTSIRFPHKTVTPEEFGRMYTKQSVVSDFDAFMRSVEEAHPNPYLYTPKGAIQSLRDSLVSRLPDSLQRIPAVLALKRLASAYQDGHLSVSADEEYEQFLEQDGRIFPFGVKLTSNGLAVTNSYTSTATVRISDVILRINGFAADSLVREFAKEQSGERAFHRQQRALNSIATNLWMHNIRAPYTLVYRPKSGTNVGTEQTSIVVGITNKERKTVQQQSQQTSSNEASSRFYSFSMLPDGIGLMRWRTMYDDKVKFAIFLNQIFSTLANDSTTKGLIIDVRDNRGGDSRYGVDMIDYLTDKPYKSGGGKVWKASRQYREFVDGLYAQIPWTIRWLPFHWFIPTLAQLRTHAQRPDGTMYVSENTDELHTPAANPLRFSKPVYVLMGINTFSSGMLFTDMIATNKIVPLMGEETGESANSFGEICFFDTPILRALISVSTARFTRINGDANDTRGILPDYPVSQTEEDSEKGVDTVLEFAKQRILQGKK